MPENQKKQNQPRPAAKDKKPMGERIAKWFREIKAEIKKITWPTRKEVVKNTAITIMIVAMLGTFIWVADFGLNSLRDFLLSKVTERESDEEIDYEDFFNDYLSSSDLSGSDVTATDVTGTDTGLADAADTNLDQ